MKIPEKLTRIIIVLVLSILIIINIVIQFDDCNYKITLDGNWKYNLNDSNEFIDKNYDDSKWKNDSLVFRNVVNKENKEKIDKVIWFRKRIVIPQDSRSLDLMLYISRMSNSHEIYFNNYLIGKTMSTPDNVFNDKNKKYGYFIPKNLINYDKENTLVIRAHSTFEYGSPEPLTIEPSDIILKRLAVYNSSYLSMFLCTTIILLSMSLYYLFLYSKMRKINKYLYFSILCLCMGIYYFSYFMSIGPISYLLFYKITTSAMFLIPLTLVLFIKEFEGEPIPKQHKINISIRLIAIVLSVFIFNDLISYHIFRKYYILIFTLDFIYIFFMVMFDFIYKKNKQIKKLIWGVIPVLFMGGHDLYYELMGSFPHLGLQLNVYALMLFLGIIALDLGDEYVSWYEQASRDGLTGLYTQSFLKNDLIETLKQKNSVSLIMADIDHFKKVNDKYGHLFGDKVLKQVSNILYDTSPKSSIVTRYGGEEFAVLIKSCTCDAIHIAEEIRTSIENFRFKEESLKDFKITISLGVISWCPDDKLLHSSELIEKADQALYFSKRNGRNRTTLYEDIESL